MASWTSAVPRRPRRWPRRQRLVTVGLVGLTLACFLFELSRGGEADQLLRRWGLVPVDVLSSPAAWVTLVTSLFLHAGWLHLLSNVVYLGVFGGSVEQRLGRLRYLGVYLASGVFGGVAYVAAQPTSDAPAGGAGGGVARIIAAHLVVGFHRAAGPNRPALL